MARECIRVGRGKRGGEGVYKGGMKRGEEREYIRVEEREGRRGSV